MILHNPSHIYYLTMHRKLINMQSPKCEKRKREGKKYFFVSSAEIAFDFFLIFHNQSHVSVDTTKPSFLPPYVKSRGRNVPSETVKAG